MAIKTIKAINVDETDPLYPQLLNIYSYFVKNIDKLDQVYYRWKKTVHYEQYLLYYKNQILYDFIETTDNRYSIVNHINNTSKIISKDTKIASIANFRYSKDINARTYNIYYMKDHNISYITNANIILYHYYLINKINSKSYMCFRINKLIYLEKIYYYKKNNVYIKNTNNRLGYINIYRFKYSKYFILVPNKYELKYYSNYCLIL